MPRQPGSSRLLVLHRNQPGVLARIDGLLAQHGLNIEQQVLSTAGAVGFAVTDVPGAVGPDDRRRAPADARDDPGARAPALSRGRRSRAAAYPRGRVRGVARPAADRCRRAARARGRPRAAHPAHRGQGRRARPRWPTRCVERTDEVLAANAADVEAAAADGTPESVLDRLRLDRRPGGRGRRRAARSWSRCPTRSGDVVRGSRLPNGLQLRQVRVPLGVVGIVYEARPNVTVDAAGLCLKSGNAALLRGSASAFRTNTALVAVLTEAGEKAGLPAGFGRAAAGRPRLGRRAAERPRPGRRRHPARRRRADRAGGARVDGAGDRDRRRQLPRLRRRLRRRGDGRGDRAQLQDPPGQRLQLRRDAAGAPRRRRSCRGCCGAWPTPG